VKAGGEARGQSYRAISQSAVEADRGNDPTSGHKRANLPICAKLHCKSTDDRLE
jgi:hypothetical protein